MEENVLTEFNTGGSHAENPIGGVPQGTGPNGQANTVEEGETKFTVGNTPYIFSNKIDNVDRFVSAFSLPPYTKGLPFSDASKKITEAFADRKDNASQSTMKAFLDRLVEAQELAKLEFAAKEADMSVEEYLTYTAQQEAQAQIAQEQQAAQEQAPQEQAPQEGEQVPVEGEAPVEGGQEQFAGGGPMTGAQAGGVAAGAAGMAGSMMSDLASAKDGEVRDKMNVGGTTAKYALMGAAAGSVVPGIGTAIGAGVGAVAGATMAIASNSKVAGEQQSFDATQQGERLKAAGYSAEYGGALNIFAEGGKVPTVKYLDGLDAEAEQSERDDALQQMEDFNAEQLYPEQTAVKNYTKVAGLDMPDMSELGKFTPIDLGESTPNTDPAAKGDNNSSLAGIGGLAASAAPFVGNMLEGMSLKRDEATRYNRVGKTYKPEFADEQGMVNQAMQGFDGSSGAIANASNGSIGSYRANMLGNSVNKSNARSNAYSRVNEINRQEEKNLNEDDAVAKREEVALSNRELLEAKQDEAAYQGAKSAYRQAAYEGLGNMGETLFQVSQQEDMTPYEAISAKRKQDKREA